MKTKQILFVIIVFLTYWVEAIAQPCNLTSEEKQEIIDSLNSSNYEVRGESIIKILDCKIFEAKEIIEERFWELGSEYISLDALYNLGSNLTYSFANAYYDTLQNEISQLDLVNDPDSVNWEVKKVLLEYLMSPIEILFAYNDFSKAYKVIELLDFYNQGEPRSPALLSALKYLINNVPQHSERAKSELEAVVFSEAYDGWTRLSCFYGLQNIYGAESYPMAKELFLNDHDEAVRISVLNILPWYTYLYQNNDVFDFLKERLSAEPDTSLFPQEIVNTLLNFYGTPSTYNYIKEFAETTPNPDLSHSILVDLRLFFKPFKPDDTSRVNLSTMLDSLKSYNQQCLTYNWIDNVLQAELNSKIQNAKTYLSGGDSINCAKEIRVVKEKIDFEYKDSLNTTTEFVTREGWQFLYYYAQYILDRLPEIPIILPPDIDIINPAMSLVNPGAFAMEVKGTGFTTNSVVYFNSNARATTFVSDSTLTAQILSTDVNVAGNFPVWVSDNSLNSDTLIYKVVSTLPQPVRPVLECVTNNGNGTYTAFFGYKNENSVSVYIPVGGKNKFTPNPQDRGQTRVFKPGRQIKVYTVNFNGSNLVWTLNGRTSTASKNSAPCQ